MDASVTFLQMREIARSGCWFAVSALLGLGCGGETTTDNGTDGQPPYDPCEDSATLERLMVADFEVVPPPSGISFFTGSDNTAPSDQLSPVPPNVFATGLEAPKCPDDAAPGSGFHITATGLQAYGYSFGFNMLGLLPGGDGSAVFDASSWDGISMWVRKGTGPAPDKRSSSSFFAAVADRYTDPSGAPLFMGEETQLLLPSTGTYCAFDAVDVDGMCVADNDCNDPLLSQCDKFGSGVGISTEWRFFKVPFSGMRQRAYGRPSTQATVDTRILGLDFGLDGENWDFWIDDLAFYRE
jgi:hypothetical protein